MLSLPGQVIFIICTLVFFALSVLLVMKFFHIKPFSTWYDNLVYYTGNSIVIFTFVFHIGYLGMAIGILSGESLLLISGMVANLLCITIFSIGFVMYATVTIYEKLSEFHQRLGKRNKQ